MSDLNRATLIGRVGKEPAVRQFASGDEVANFSLATNELWTTKAGIKEKKTTWHEICVYNPRLIDLVRRYVKSGDMLFVEGQIQIDEDENKKKFPKVVLKKFDGAINLLGSSKKEDAGSSNGAPYSPTPPSVQIDDDIPF